MKYLINVQETYRVDTESAVDELIAEAKTEALNNDYTVTKCASTLKEKKRKGQVVDSGYLVSIQKVYHSFWEE